jgi:dienelactone hydrolase
VLLPEARNHGESDADTFSSLPRFAEDLDAALAWLKAQPGIDSARLVAVGHSVGGAAALLSASRRSDLMAVVSVSAFAHPERVMRRWLAARHIPYWPLGWGVNRYVERVIGHRFDAIAPMNTVRRVNCPVILVHGSRDDVVPPACARELQRLAPPGRAQLIEAPGTHEAFDNESALLDQITDALHALEARRIPSASVLPENVLV